MQVCRLNNLEEHIFCSCFFACFSLIKIRCSSTAESLQLLVIVMLVLVPVADLQATAQARLFDSGAPQTLHLQFDELLGIASTAIPIPIPIAVAVTLALLVLLVQVGPVVDMIEMVIEGAKEQAKQLTQIDVVGLVLEAQVARVFHEQGELDGPRLADLIDAHAALQLQYLLVFLLLVRRHNALPGQLAQIEVHNAIAKRLQVVAT